MRKLSVLLLVGLLGGCALPTEDMLNNDFATVSLQPVPPEIAGTWTGSNGPYLMTLAISASGSGMSCYAWGDKQTAGRIKFDGKFLRFQDGTRLILARQGDSLIGRAPYSNSRDIVFVSDPDLVSAAPYCSQKL